MLEKLFKLKDHNTTVKTEITAGITTFMTMAYILAVNPSILSEAGMNANAVLIATCIASFIGTALMAFTANMPFALSAGMGLNAYLAYTVVLGMGVSWQLALFAVFIEGFVFIVLSLTNVREAIFNAIPLTLKQGVSVGIGLFIAFIGLQNAGLCVDSSTLVTITSFTENFNTTGICALLAVVGILITAILYIQKIKGAILYGIILTWGLGILCQFMGIYVPNPEAGAYSLLPTGFVSVDFTSLGETFGQCFNIDFSSVGIFNFIVIIFSFLFVDFFDTAGTLVAVGTEANLVDTNGNLVEDKKALLADSVGTVVGACLGTPTVTSYIESTTGIAAGARTGLSATVTGVLFLLSLLIYPALGMFGSVMIDGVSYSPVTSLALVYVGTLMFGQVKEIDWKDTVAIASTFLVLILMLLTNSISDGIVFGMISYVIMMLAARRHKEVHPILYALSALFVVYLVVKFAAF